MSRLDIYLGVVFGPLGFQKYPEGRILETLGVLIGLGVSEPALIIVAICCQVSCHPCNSTKSKPVTVLSS